MKTLREQLDISRKEISEKLGITKRTVSSYENESIRPSQKIAEKIIKSHPDIDAIWGENDEMALGAADAVKSSSKSGQIFTIGTDGNQNAFEAIKKEHLTATLNTNPMEMGKILMRTVIRNRIKEEKIEPYIWSPINIVDLENVEENLSRLI